MQAYRQKVISSAWGLAIMLLLSLTSPLLHAEITPERQAQLLHMLRHDCGSCHGMTLKGGLGPALLPQDLASKPATLLTDTIYYGRPGTPMPPWRGIVSREEAEWLVVILSRGVDDHVR